MQMNLPTRPTHGPRRRPSCGVPGTTGSVARSISRRRARPAAVSTSPAMSGTTADRSRTRPSASSTPGRSYPRGPWRSSFMEESPGDRKVGAQSYKSVVEHGRDLRVVDVGLVVPVEARVDDLGQLLALERLDGRLDGLVADAHR